MATKFTPEQIKWFRSYYKVQKSSRFNMFDPRARIATGLDRDEFLFVLNNYEALELAARKEGKL
jgi:hypothetical protein